MGVLDDLIRMKTVSQEDDLLKMIDEIPVYEKLSADEKLRDLKNSAVTRAKCPLLAGMIDGNLYETVLADLVSNIYLQIEGIIPDILHNESKKSAKQKRQIQILQKGIVNVIYRDIMEYDHEIMKDDLVAVFTKKSSKNTIIAIIVKESSYYAMYHGSYSSKSDDSAIRSFTPIIIKSDQGVFTMNSYSILGNNGYRFGTYANSHTSYDIMIGANREMYLMNGDMVVMTHEILWDEWNELQQVKRDPEMYARTIINIIESVV